MAWYDRVMGRAPAPVVAPPEPKRAPADAALAGAAAGRALGPGQLTGGRLTQDQFTASAFFATRFVLPPPSDEDDWRLEELDDATLSRTTPTRLMELLANLSPDVSRALYDYQRLCNAGWEALAYIPGTRDPSDKGQAALDAFRGRLGALYGTPDVVVDRLFLEDFLRGAQLAELVLDPTGRVAIDLATPDPAVIRFRRRDDDARGPVWQMCQWQGGQLVDLDRETICYVPVDPFPGSPYGRPMAAPALFTALFMLGLLHDLRRVVAQQGYPRLDFKVNSEVLRAMMADQGVTDPAQKKAWIEAAIAAIKTEYASLAPDDAFVHLDAVDVNQPVGAMSDSSLGMVDGLIKALERQTVRALKSHPFLFGLSESTTETQANRQFEMMAQSIRSVQHRAENLLSRLFGLALRVQGIAATVEVRFAENRASEAQKDETVLGLKIDNYVRMRDQGWIDQEEAAFAVTGHEPVADAPVPAQPPGDDEAPTDAVLEDPEPGVNRSAPLQPRANGYHGGGSTATAILDGQRH
jgi:hypothetical protein